jgi:hypothetical protein
MAERHARLNFHIRKFGVECGAMAADSYIASQSKNTIIG